ncbi:MAG: transporter permease [Myxococcales bacterium]|nr:transporter permease [Myxococcales bacterium]
MDTLWKDLRFALRMLRRTPGVAAAAVIALALGIGANTAIFSVVDGVLLRPLPYQDSRALHVLNGKFPTQGLAHVPLSYPEFKDVLEQSRTLAAVGAFAQGDSNLSGDGGPPDRVVAGVASASFFPTLGVQPFMGRGFLHAEELKGADQVVMLDHGLWQRRFASDANVVGKELILDNQPYRIIGVLPKGFQIDQKCDLWIPLSTSVDLLTVRGAHFLKVVGRAKAGTTRDQLAADLDAVSERLRETYPNNYRRGVGWALEAKPLIDDVVGDVRLSLWVLLGAVAFVLLIACANVANLMLARAAARHKEMAIRTALGAGRWRLIRQMLTESVILSIAGGGLGLLLAVWGVDAMVAMSPDALPRSAEVSLDGRVLAFTIGVSVLTGLAFGLMPALSASRPDMNDALKDGTRGTTSSRGRLRRALVIAEVGLSMVLLVGTGLMLRSFLQLREVKPGFRPDHVLTLRVSLPTPNGTAADADTARYAAFFARATKRLAELPGVQAAGGITLLPLDGDSTDNSFEIENYVPRSPGDLPDNEVREVTPGYFTAMGVPLLAGRLLAESDDKGAPPVVVINQAMAKRYWRDGEDPIGKHLKLKSARSPQKDWSTVVGIVGDVRGFGLDKPAKAEMYFAHDQLRRSAAMALVLRTAGEPTAMANSARAVIGEIDPKQPVFNVRTMEDYLSSSMAQRRFSLVLMLIFGGVALLLAAVGIYGVMSYTVAQRTQEIGIRVALGATPGNVLGMVVRQGMTLVAIGLGAGIIGSLAVTRLVSSLLYGVSTTDFVTYLVIAVALGSVALLATVIPARRATRVDPMLALRAD